VISVIVPSYNARATVDACLRSIVAQDLRDPWELIVADSSDDGTDAVIRRDFPAVRVLRLERRTPAGAARQHALAVARAPLIAFTDADCVVAPDWLRRILARHAAGEHPAVGGTVANGTPESLLGSAEHLFAFNEFLPGMPARLLAGMPTCNLSYRREVLQAVAFESGPDGEYLQPEDLLLNWRATGGARVLFFDPDIRVTHLNRTHLGPCLRHQHLIGRSACWARKRADLPGRVFAERPWLSPAVPVLRVGRIAVRLWRTNRRELGRFVVLLPWILLVALAWGAGFTREAFRRAV
jgi:glycosyltransferase involved in cell wall biosynthesis